MKKGLSSGNKKILFALMLALMFAGMAIFGTYQMLTPQRTNVYIFNSTYTAGTQITHSMLTSIEVDSKVVTASNNAATSDFLITEDNYNTVITSAGTLRNDVYQGNIFTSAMLSTTGGNRLEMVMQKNAVAVSIGVNNVTGITTGLSYGSRVNVYANYNESTVLVLQNIRVLGVNYDGTNISSATLELDISDSLKLIHAYNYGSIHLGLVDATGYQYTNQENPTYSLDGFSASSSATPPPQTIAE